MLRLIKPSRIIEIGSGFSSAATLDTNELFFNDSINCTFIEPYPNLLYRLLKPEDSTNPQISILPNTVQDCDLSLFRNLNANDIVFIDSSHVVKSQSDLITIFFDIIPNLKPGVIIHFHDIFYPFEYPLGWLEQGCAWNEAYILRALLQNNARYRILYWQDMMFKFFNSYIAEHYPKFMLNSGGNIWIGVI